MAEQTDVVTLTLSRERATALLSVLDSAQEARTAYEKLVQEHPDWYSDEDKAETRAWHRRERGVDADIRTQLRTQGVD